MLQEEQLRNRLRQLSQPGCGHARSLASIQSKDQLTFKFEDIYTKDSINTKRLGQNGAIQLTRGLPEKQTFHGMEIVCGDPAQSHPATWGPLVPHPAPVEQRVRLARNPPGVAKREEKNLTKHFGTVFF